MCNLQCFISSGLERLISSGRPTIEASMTPPGIKRLLATFCLFYVELRDRNNVEKDGWVFFKRPMTFLKLGGVYSVLHL